MSVERAIHEHWKTYRPLAELVPPDRFRTGWLPPAEASPLPLESPYVTLQLRDERDITRTSGGGELATVVFRFNIRSHTLDEAKRIAAELDSRFSRHTFSHTGVTIQDMKRISRREIPQEDSSWHIELDYLTRTES